ncbi:hypothetical protein TPHA_0B00610 [Tetrapisispora phaffii CBS 4417]|uniref:CNH domain-containing protein n=1 Tax=Tetrapisispora phaffii (strain ATCC 24235 / CBS 4417 / NBRC 1672 / NRRL Y-8282 / UCD 70-5) TaxID=1071381 RepID=G8BQD6_TETPH|nr:hypothetical protein TPHA_0B00610 [Tetrapisispora phaffii CBS 4417]CCE61733.1 hypothetical protein TPHA_0B00610 [Tetrapisispora phaffii CBS 4417]
MSTPYPISSSSPERKSKSNRPPPPPISNLHDNIISLNQQKNREPLKSPDSYRSPFIFESSTSISPTNRNNSPTYPSPFIGENDPNIYKTSSDLTNNSNFRSGSNLSSSQNNFRKISSQFGLLSGTISDNPTFFERPSMPKSIPVSSRNISWTSRISDSIDSVYTDSNYTFNNSNARHSSFNSLLGGKPLELAPSLTAPIQPFSMNFLDENKLYQCYSVSKLSDIYEWILKVYFEWFNECFFNKIEFFQMIQLLLEFQMPKTFDQDIIDSNVDRIIESLVSQGAVRFEVDSDNFSSSAALNNTNLNSNNEIAIIVSGLDVSGIFTELLPCYSFLDTTETDGNSNLCYSYTCLNRFSGDGRDKVELSEIINKSVGLWTEYWKLTPEELSEINPREIQRQSFIFDLIILEERSLNMANAAVEIYGKRFSPDLLPEDTDFSSLAFDIFEPLIRIHKELLLDPIFWKLKTRGKFIDLIGKIYLKWCHEAKDMYINYAVSMATVHEIITWEKQHNTAFARWLKDIDNLPDIRRSKMYYDVIFFGGFFKSLQNLPITLNSVWKNTDASMEDYHDLQLAIKEIENLSSEVDRVHGIAIDRRKLVRFSKQLVYDKKNSFPVGYVNLSSTQEEKEKTQDKLELGLSDNNRKLLMSGIVHKKRELWLDPTEIYLALLDNFLLITERVIKGDVENYKLVERPIPIEYLNLEKRKKQEEDRSSSYIPNTPISSVRPNLISAASTVSKSLIATPTKETYHSTEISNVGGASEFSFKVRNLATNESYTFLTSTNDENERWIASFLVCFKQNDNLLSTIVFSLNVITDQFLYAEKDAPVNLPMAPEGSELDNALRKYEEENVDNSSKILLPSAIFCSVSISFEGNRYTLLAIEQGVFMKKEDKIGRNFVKLLDCKAVKCMEVNIKLGLLFILDNRRLCYYNIPSILGAYYAPKKYLPNNRIVGILIRDKVSCFKMAEDFGNSKHLLYERKGKIVILTPEFDKLTNSFKFYKIYKKYLLPISTSSLLTLEIHDIVVFKKSFIVCTSKGNFVFNDSFNDTGISIPTFFNDKDIYPSIKSSHFTNTIKNTVEPSSKKEASKYKMVEYVKKDIANKKTKTCTCFQISNTSQFIVVYDEAVILLNQFGEIADWKNDIMVLDFCCTNASLIKNYLLLVSDNLIQIYNINSNIKLSKLTPIQILKGKKIKMINSNKTENLIVSISHPNIPNRQLLASLNLVDI